MRLLVINPNSTQAMTDGIAAAARKAASPSTEIIAVNPVGTPPAIQNRDDVEAATPAVCALFEEMLSGPDSFDAAIIACFDDVGLRELKPRSPVPVIGIGEAGFHAATLLGPRFSVVTTLEMAIPGILENIADYGFADHCARVRASGVPVLGVSGGDHGAERIASEVRKAVAHDDCRAVVLGCAAMAGLAESLSAEIGLPVIDGVSAAVKFAEAIVSLKTPI